MSCKDCKKKTTPIKSLSSTDESKLTEAFNMLQTPSLMDNDKWDFVEDVYLDLFPTKRSIKRSCRECLINVAKAIEYEYKKITKK